MGKRERVVAVVGVAVALLGMLALAALRFYAGVGPDRAVIPAGETWWCYATPRGAGCARTGPECVAQLTFHAVTGREVCATQPEAWCFTRGLRRQETGRSAGAWWQCFPTREACAGVADATGGTRCTGVE